MEDYRSPVADLPVVEIYWLNGTVYNGPDLADE